MTNLRDPIVLTAIVAALLAGCASATKGTAPDSGSAEDTSPACKSTPPQCDLFPQCGCPTIDKCAVISSSDGTTACTPAGGLDVDGRCLSSSKDCAKGLACRFGLCRPYCGDNPDCATSKGTCRVVAPGAKACEVECDPMAPATACGSENCEFQVPDGFACGAAGSATGALGCVSDVYACAPGYACSAAGNCRKWCRVSGSDCGGKPCERLPSTPTLAGVEYGICQL